MAKLTLHVPEELVAAAKSEALARDVSVSKLVTDFFRHLAAESPDRHSAATDRLAPRTRQLAGCVPDADIEDYVDYLEKKHS
jgi:hypothetical protein